MDALWLIMQNISRCRSLVRALLVALGAGPQNPLITSVRRLPAPKTPPCYSWSAMYSHSSACNCGHPDTWHLQNSGPCIHHNAGGFCGCERFYPFHVRVPVKGKFPALPMKNTLLTPWAHQK